MQGRNYLSPIFKLRRDGRKRETVRTFDPEVRTITSLSVVTHGYKPVMEEKRQVL